MPVVTSASSCCTAWRSGAKGEPHYQGRGVLRAANEELLLAFVWMEVERMQRIADEHPSMVGQMGWTCAALGASEHLAQLYAELKRRYRAKEARARLRAVLDGFVAWDGGDGLPPRAGRV